MHLILFEILFEVCLSPEWSLLSKGGKKCLTRAVIVPSTGLSGTEQAGWRRPGLEAGRPGFQLHLSQFRCVLKQVSPFAPPQDPSTPGEGTFLAGTPGGTWASCRHRQSKGACPLRGGGYLLVLSCEAGGCCSPCGPGQPAVTVRVKGPVPSGVGGTGWRLVARLGATARRVVLGSLPFSELQPEHLPMLTSGSSGRFDTGRLDTALTAGHPGVKP